MDDKNLHEITQLYQAHMNFWYEHILFSWRWWLGVGVIIIGIIVFLSLRKSRQADRLFYAGFFTAIISMVLDMIGHYLGLWEYRYEVYPPAAYFPWDIFFIPTVVMLLLLVKPAMNPWIKAIVLGLATSLIGLPVLNWLGIYNPLNWHYIYSFPIQVVIYLIAHYVSRRTKFDPLNN